jgi:hypothetical protein
MVFAVLENSITDSTITVAEPAMAVPTGGVVQTYYTIINSTEKVTRAC